MFAAVEEDRGAFKKSALNNGSGSNDWQSIGRRHLHSKQEVARAVGVSPRTLDAWMAQKRIPFLRLSARLIRFDLERVTAALGRFEVREVGRRS